MESLKGAISASNLYDVTTLANNNGQLKKSHFALAVAKTRTANLPPPPPQRKTNRMKKLNLFNPSGRRKSDRGGGAADNARSQSLESNGSGDTLNRIVNQKEEEKRKFEREQAQFDRRRREYELNLVEIERKEVERREEEVRRRNEELDEKKRKHKMVQDAVQEQIKVLQRKLEELKVEYKDDEENQENDIEKMEDKLLEVKQGLEQRVKDLKLGLDKEDETNSVVTLDIKSMPVPSAPRACPLREDEGGPYSMYPPIPVMTRSYESSKVLQAAPQVLPRQNPLSSATSVGSSPLSNHSASSRSTTPKTDVSDSSA